MALSVRPCVRLSIRPCVRHIFVSGLYFILRIEEFENKLTELLST